jgi:uncharacterized membrane protein
MTNNLQETALRLLKTEYSSLTAREQRVIQAITNRVHVSRSVNREFDEKLTFGQQLADKVAGFGGSWPFIIIFSVVLTAWIVANSLLLLRPFDPFPYILLNLFLSMLAAMQAPIIMMSQNRQVAKDRLDAAQDYEINLKAELEIQELQSRLDALQSIQVEQLRLLRQLAAEKGDSPAAA